MQMRKRPKEIIKLFADTVRNNYPKAKILAFGSYVRGEAAEDSDMDLCVVLPGMQSDDRLKISDIAWEVGFENDLHLSTIVVSEENFSRGPIASSPLLDTIRNEGIAA